MYLLVSLELEEMREGPGVDYRFGVSASNHSLSSLKITDTLFVASGVQAYRLHVLAVLWSNLKTTLKVCWNNQHA